MTVYTVKFHDVNTFDQCLQDCSHRQPQDSLSLVSPLDLDISGDKEP